MHNAVTDTHQPELQRIQNPAARFRVGKDIPATSTTTQDVTEAGG